VSGGLGPRTRLLLGDDASVLIDSPGACALVGLVETRLADREASTSVAGTYPVDQLYRQVQGDLADSVEIINQSDDPSSASPVDTPLWDTFQRVAGALSPGSKNVPFMTVGATDARFFRRLGIPSYGFGLFSTRITFDQFSSMFHGDDERVDQDALRLSTELWEAVARDLLAHPT